MRCSFLSLLDGLKRYRLHPNRAWVHKAVVVPLTIHHMHIRMLDEDEDVLHRGAVVPSLMVRGVGMAWSRRA